VGGVGIASTHGGFAPTVGKPTPPHPSLTESREELVWEVALWEVLVSWKDRALLEGLAISEVMDLWEDKA
jgi:hypothetical protein